MTNPNHRWLQKQLEPLLEWAKRLPKDGPVTEYRYFTALKLIALNYYSSVFTRVANNQVRQGRAGASVYVDLLAGTGLVRIKGASRAIHLAGSSICAASASHGGFGRLVCVEAKADRCGALKRRLESTIGAGKFDIIRGDCNQKIGEVISAIKSRYRDPIVLVFVDPQAFEIKFKTLARLAAAFERCDFMIHVNANAVTRERGKITKKAHNASPKILEKYFDMPALKIFEKLATMSPEQQYESLVREKLGKKIGDSIKIKNTGKQTAYYILCYTRRTRGGSGYADSIPKLKKQLEECDASSVKQQIEIMDNNQQTLDRKPSLKDYL